MSLAWADRDCWSPCRAFRLACCWSFPGSLASDPPGGPTEESLERLTRGPVSPASSCPGGPAIQHAPFTGCDESGAPFWGWGLRAQRQDSWAALLGMSHLQELPAALISLTPPRSALSWHLFGTREASVVALLTAVKTGPVGITTRCRNGTRAGVKVKGANGLGSGRSPRSQGGEVSVSFTFLTEPLFLGP